MIWFQKIECEQINQMCKNTMVDFCGIEFTKITENEIHAIMPVKDNLKQPFGIVHGGANCVLAETMGSIAANLTCNPKTSHAVGVSITTNHIKAVRNGVISAVVKPVHVGKKIQVWDIETFNDAHQLTSKTSLTMAIIEKLN